MSVLVFVYGTLRPPRPDTNLDDSRYYPRIEAYVKEAVPARLEGALLYDLGTYPAARPGEGAVYGELLTVKPRALHLMDQIEGHPRFYRRKRVEVYTSDGPVKAWIYWAPEGLVTGRHPVPGGDWFLRPAAADIGEPATASTTTSPPDPTLLALVHRLAESECSWLSTVRPDGRAHASPVWHIWHQGRVYIVTTSKTVKVANIMENPSVVLAHPDPLNPVILEGWATQARAVRSGLRPRFQKKYAWDIESDSSYDTVLEITPTRLLAWGEHGDGCWSGEDVIGIRLDG